MFLFMLVLLEREEVKGCKAGDKVLVNGFSGSDVEFGDGSKGKFITMDDVIAVIS